MHPFTLLGMLLASQGSLPSSWKVTEVASDVVVVTHQPFAANSLILEVQRGTVILVDSPSTPADTHRLLAWIKARYDNHPIAVLTSHWHADASAGNQVFAKAGIRTISSKRTAELLRTKGVAAVEKLASHMAKDSELSAAIRKTVPTPASETYDVTDRVELDIAGEKVWLIPAAPSHSEDSIGVYFPTRKILYGGCVVRHDGKIVYLGEADLSGWRNALANFEELAPAVVIPGHGPRFEPAMLKESQQAVAALMPPAQGRPVCRNIGTRSEGWRWPDGQFIRWGKCKGLTPRCKKSKVQQEGWYAHDMLIVTGACKQAMRKSDR